MTERTNVSTGTHFEEEFGYNRLVKKGPYIAMAGTVAIDEGEVVGPGDPYEQAAFALEVIEETLSEVGAELNDVVRTRIYVLDFDDWEEIGRAHREAFPTEQPATTMVSVDELPADGLVLEIEVDAIAD